MESPDPVIALIHARRGLAPRLGELLGITREAVSMWKRVPAPHVLAVAKHLKLHPHSVRPDLYPPPRRRKSARVPGRPPRADS